MADFEIEEGGICPSCGNGYMVFHKIENCGCSFHLHPPCGACEDSMLQCNNCLINQDEIFE